jgi:hypothetical protein
MKTVYMVWHQAEGVVPVVFGQVPTDEQVHAIRDQLAVKWPGFEKCEMRVRSLDMIEWAELPVLEGIEAPVPAAPGARVDMTKLTASATGFVEPPK